MQSLLLSCVFFGAFFAPQHLGAGISVCVHLHGYVLLKLPDYVGMCKDMVPKAEASSWGHVSMAPCIHILMCYRGGEVLIALLLGILCARLLVYPYCCVSCVLWYACVTTSVCVEVIKPMRASMSCPSFSLVNGHPFLGWLLFLCFLHFPHDLTSFSRQDWGEGWAGPSPRLKPSFHFLLASFLAVFLIFAIWPGTVPIQFH